MSRGRGALTNPDNRFSSHSHEAFDDGWSTGENVPAPLTTVLRPDSNRSMISRNDSPDVPFDQSINPYRGCEHGCIYCYARPTHAWLGHSPGLDFESLLYYKTDAAESLRRELGKQGYRCKPLAIGGVTDAYQPVEKRLKLMRGILQLLVDCGQPTTLLTKSALVERDIDLLTKLASRRQAQVMISITTLERDLARRLEPRAAAPQRRLQTIARLSRAGIPVGVLVAPVIPVLTDPELERIMTAARNAGAVNARYILLRLPREVAGLFSEWLETHVPQQAARILKRIRDTQGGALYRSQFGQRMSGEGPYAEMIAQRFQLARKRLGFREMEVLDCSAFSRPCASGGQLSLL
ncbi:MAG: PA0069 family radical SAM protein [Gammaproteobacteria bacterium]|nr:PA0069 family radical SAM protein [Gammaproteobacteria bacterium]